MLAASSRPLSTRAMDKGRLVGIFIVLPTSLPASAMAPSHNAWGDGGEGGPYSRATGAGAGRVAEADDGRAGLSKIEEAQPDLILLDLMMPGMDGWQFRVEQRKRPALSEIPVVVTSGDDSPYAAAIDATATIKWARHAGSQPAGMHLFQAGSYSAASIRSSALVNWSRARRA